MKGSWRIVAFLCILAVGIKIFSFFPDAVEAYYNASVYKYLLAGQELIFGSLSFSGGDILYVTAGILLLYQLFRFIRGVMKGEMNKAYWKRKGAPLLIFFLGLYSWFNIFWGLNYNRPGLDRSLGLDTFSVQKSELLDLLDTLVDRVNQRAAAAHVLRPRLQDPRYVFAGTADAYAKLAEKDNRFFLLRGTVKSSLFGFWGNYLGYTGYYNPFTGEAQVNTAVPLLLQPYTSCHEWGHRLGFARENDANFAGYLAASGSPDTAFQYAVYFDLYLYGRSYLKRTDTALLTRFDQKLLPLVLQDVQEIKAFYRRYENPIGLWIDWLYDSYLQANQQPEGKQTYAQVIYWLAAYRKKYGRI